jgi:hypothetical protein
MASEPSFRVGKRFSLQKLVRKNPSFAIFWVKGSSEVGKQTGGKWLLTRKNRLKLKTKI